MMLSTVFTALVVFLGVMYFVIRRFRLPQAPSRAHWRGKIFGHRGVRGIPGIVENTMPAFEYAASHGCDGIETDLRITKDGHCVLFHDPFLAAEFPVKQGIRTRDLTLAEIRALRFKCDPSKTAQVPTLEEAVAFCRDRRLLIILDIKDSINGVLVDAVLSLCEKYGDYLHENATIISFSFFELYMFRRRDPKLAVGIMYSGDLMHMWLDFKRGGMEVPHMPRILFWPSLKFNDALLEFAQTVLAPPFVRPSVLGPRAKTLTPKACAKLCKMLQQPHSPLAIFIWDLGMTLESITQKMVKLRPFLAVDDNHGTWRQKLDGN